MESSVGHDSNPTILSAVEIAAALRHETNARIRKRLIAMQALLSGKDRSTAAHIARTTPESIRSWVSHVRAGGLSALLNDRRTGKTYRLDMTPDILAATRSEIERLLAQERRAWARLRLRAVHALLDGGCSLKQAALSAGAHPDRLSLWLRWVQDAGCKGLLVRPPAQAGMPAMTTGEIAKAERAIDRMLARRPPLSPRTQQRLRALRMAIRGKIDEAATASYVSTKSIRAWLRILRKQGLQALVEKPHPGRPRSRLS